MKRLSILVGLAISLLPLPSLSQAADANFAGIPFGSTKASVRSTLVDRGYPFQKMDGDGDYWFSGKFDNFPLEVIAIFDGKGGLVKTVLNIETPDESAREEYTHLLVSMKQKYGTPSDDFHFFKSPYADGDGSEVAAFKNDKATFAAYWKGNGAQNYTSIEITNKLTVEIDYEGPGWHDEVERRKHSSTRDL